MPETAQTGLAIEDVQNMLNASCKKSTTGDFYVCTVEDAQEAEEILNEEIGDWNTLKKAISSSKQPNQKNVTIQVKAEDG